MKTHTDSVNSDDSSLLPSDMGHAAGQDAHTPTPWLLVDDGQAWPHVAAEYLPHGPVCEMPSYDPENEGNGDRARQHALANAAFIVRACNGWNDANALRARLAELEASK